MKEILINMAIATLLAALREVAQLPALKRAMVKLFSEITKAYAGDEEFDTLVQVKLGKKETVPS